MSIDTLKDAITESANVDLEGTVQVLSAAFLGLFLSYVELRGEDPSVDIHVNFTDAPPGMQRKITIHATPVSTGGEHEHIEPTN